MSPKDLRTTLDCWAAWVESGRPVPFNSWPPASILLGLHLPGRATDEARAQELGITIAAARHARRLADRALEGL